MFFKAEQCNGSRVYFSKVGFNTLRTGDADSRFYVTSLQDG